MNPASAPKSVVLVTPLVAVISYLGLFALTAMVELGPWMRTVGLMLAVVTAVIVGVRLLTRSRVLPSLAGLAASIWLLVAVYAKDEDGNGYLLPTPRALTDFGTTLRNGVDLAAETVAPAPYDPRLIAIIATSMLFMFVLAEHLAVSWRMAASAGLVLLTPWMPAILFQHRVSPVALVVSLALWLVTLALTRSSQGTPLRPAWGSALLAGTAAVVAMLLVAPTALGGNGWGMIPRIAPPESLNAATRLNLAIDLRNSLTSQSTSPVIEYTTSGAKPDALRLYELSDFNGVSWSRDSPTVTGINANDGLLWPTSAPRWGEDELTDMVIQVQSLAERNLPLPPVPRTVDVATGDWTYDPERDEVTTQSGSSLDTTFAVRADLGFHTKESLLASQEAIDAGADLTAESYLEISPAIDDSRVRDVVAEVVGDATTRYDQAVALQDFLRDPAQFTYDTSVDPGSGDAVSTFLDDRVGYCVQFATTMVVMARSLDIPSRLAVGFLPGDLVDLGTYSVRGSDAHAWPELWFPGEGWVRFEPTPSVQTGRPPLYADPTTTDNTPVDEDVLNGAQNDPPVPQPDQPTPAPQVPQPAPTGPADQGTPAWLWIVVAAIVVSLAGAAAWWAASRTRSRGHELHDAETVWERLRLDLPEPMRWSSALTPHEAVESVDDAMRAEGAEFTGAAREALTLLSRAVEDDRYHPQGTTRHLDEMREWSHAVTREAHEAIKAQKSAT